MDILRRNHISTLILHIVILLRLDLIYLHSLHHDIDVAKAVVQVHPSNQVRNPETTAIPPNITIAGIGTDIYSHPSLKRNSFLFSIGEMKFEETEVPETVRLEEREEKVEYMELEQIPLQREKRMYNPVGSLLVGDEREQRETKKRKIYFV